MDTIDTRTAGAIQAAIEAAEQSVLGVSEAAGIPRTTLIRKLAGHSSFTINEVERIAGVLGLTVQQLLDAADAA